jgi:hypothetical protein
MEGKMAKTEQNLKVTEEFIRSVLKTNFGQDVRPDALRAAAEKLCDSIPMQKKQAA